METKKNPKKDLRRNSIFYFQIGMILVLAAIYAAIEYKTYDKKDIEEQVVSFNQLEEEEEKVMVMPNHTPPPPPPPPPPAPEQLEVVDDDAEVEETVIESTEVTEEPEIVEVSEVETVETEEEIQDVPFSAVQDVPIFPGCEKYKSNAERKACMEEKIKKFVDRKFNTDLGAELGLSGINRVIVVFKIDSKGKISNVQVRAPHPRLEQEAARVIKLLPEMTPGKQRGRPVGVLYNLPIIFKIQ